jgi:precorrin-6A/cobalt-precorrin-6A reductase
MKGNAAEAARVAGVPLLGVLRPGWQAAEGDAWTEVDDMNAAASALGKAPRRVWLTIGQKDLAAFQAAPWHHYVVRSVDPPDSTSLPPDATVISARGPFREADEIALMRTHGIDVLVTKNSGGSATAPKLAAGSVCPW